MAQQQFTEQEKRDLHYVFSLYDAGETGWLEVEDVHRALRLLGFKTARATVEEIADSRAAGQQPATGVSFDSFLAIVARLQGSSYDVHEELLQAFQKLDSGSDGFLSVEDLKSACAELKLKMSQRDIQEMVEEADRDGDGRVSKEEFVQIMLRTPLFCSTKT